MAAALFRLPTSRIIDSNGIADGATLTFYDTGTLTPRPVYTTSALDVAHPNPLTVAAGAAVPSIYLDDAYVYRCIVKNAAGTTIDDIDPYTGTASSGVTYTDPGTGAVTRSLNTLTRHGPWVNALNFLTAAQITDVTGYTGALDVTSALQAALDAAWGSNRDLFIPAGLYLVTGLTLPGGNATRTRAFRVYGQGGGELFARGFDAGTIIKSATDAPILRAIQDLASAGNGNQEVAYIRFEQTHTTTTEPVVLFDTLYAQSEFHHCGIFQAGNGDGLRVKHANTVEIHHNYVINSEWLAGPVTGIGIHVTVTNDNGLLTLRKNTSRGFETAYKIGSDTASEDGYIYGWRMEQCEGSVNVNGALLSSRARDGAIDNCYFEGGAGGYGIKNEGNGNTISNNHFAPGYATCIDDSTATNRGSLVIGNVMSLGNASTAAANPAGIKLDGSTGAKTAYANRIIVDHVSGGAVTNAKGIVLSGAAPLLTVTSNEFEQLDWSGASGSQKIDDNTTGLGVTGLQQVEDGGSLFDVLARGGLSLYDAELTDGDITATTLTLPRGTAFAFYTSAPVTVTTFASAHDLAGSFVILRFANGNPTLTNSATIALRGGRSFTGTNQTILLYCYKYIGTNYWVEIGRSDENSASKGVAVADAAGANPTKAEFDALLTSLRNANLIAT